MRKWVEGLLSRTSLARDLIMICLGSLVFAVGIDCFEVPNDIAAGGITGVATVVHEVAGRFGITLPIGMQSLVINGVLLILVMRAGGLRYAARTIVGIVMSGVFIDLLAPVVPHLGGENFLLAALWGGLIGGVGLGIVFRYGGNTGGTDIIAQLLAKRTGIPVGMLMMVCNVLTIAVAIPVFSLENALYATVCCVVTSWMIGCVVEGPRMEKTALIASNRNLELAHGIEGVLGKRCVHLKTEVVGQGMLLITLHQNELSRFRDVVHELDPNARVLIIDVRESFGGAVSA